MQEKCGNKWQVMIDLIVVTLLGTLLFSPFLGRRDFWSSRETRVAQAARQMRRSGNWLIPRIGGKPRLEKPPLAYWLVAGASFLANDVTPFNSRLPSILAAIGSLLLVYFFGRDLWGHDAGIRAALILATTIAFWRESRKTGIEAHLLFFNMLALYAWWHYRFAGTTIPIKSAMQAAAGQGSIKWLIVYYLALSFSFLDKGPVGPLLVAAIIATFLLITRNRRGNRSRIIRHIIGIGLFCAVAMPWHIAVLFKKPGAWSIWLHQSADRLGGFAHPHSPFYFLGVIASDAQPWLIFAIAAIFLGPRKTESNQAHQAWLLPLVWTGTTLLFFSIPTDKKSYYVMMLYPGMALAATWTLIQLRQHEAHIRMTIILNHILRTAAGIVMLIGVALPPLYFLKVGNSGKFAEFSGHGLAAITIALALLCGGYALWWCTRNRHFNQTARVIWVCTVIMIGSNRSRDSA